MVCDNTELNIILFKTKVYNFFRLIITLLSSQTSHKTYKLLVFSSCKKPSQKIKDLLPQADLPDMTFSFFLVHLSQSLKTESYH